MARARLSGAKLKLERAREHIVTLRSGIDAYFATSPLIIDRSDEPVTGDEIYRVRIKNEVPLAWSAIIGDAIHNLRSSLDLLACELVTEAGGIVSDRTAFPIRESEADFRRDAPKLLAGADPTALKLVRRLRPFRGGNEVLYRLHRLDILDKHRAIVAVGAAYSHFTMQIRMKVPWQEEPVEAPPIAIRPADRLFPLKDGETVFCVKAAARTNDCSQAKYGFAFYVAFGDGQVADGEPVAPTLTATADHIGRVLEIVERFCFAA
jgi:hypothetical protein